MNEKQKAFMQKLVLKYVTFGTSNVLTKKRRNLKEYISYKAGYTACHERAEKVLVAVLTLISKNNSDECEIYTMGCDCDEEAKQALAEWEFPKEQG